MDSNNTKNTVLVGGSQIIQIGTTFIRAKIIAIILGPVGIGFYSVLISIIMTIQQLCSIGIHQSAIRELSIAFNTDKTKYQEYRCQFFKLSRVLALGGVIVMALLSPMFNDFFFEQETYTFYICLCSLAIGFLCLGQTFNTLLQSSRNLKSLAKATILSSLAVLLLAVPLICFFKLWGIVLAIIGGYAISYFVSKWQEKKIYYESMIDKHNNIHMDSYILKPIVSRGFFLMLGGFSITLFTFLINGFISDDGMTSVGYYNSAASIMSQGLVVCSVVLASEFYPRISVLSDINVLNESVEEELKLLFYLVAPIVALFICLAPLIVSVLYTSEFAIVVTLIRIMALSLLARVIWMVYSYVILSRGDKYSYFLIDGLCGNGINFIISIIAYKLYGLVGIAIAWIVSSILVSILLCWYCHYSYKTNIPWKHFFKVGIYFSILAIVSCVLILQSSLVAICISCVITGITIYLSFRKIKQKVNIARFLQ